MENYQNAMEQAKSLAGSSAGRQLIKLLQQTGNVDMEKLKKQAAAGDFAAVQQNLAGILNNPEVTKLLRLMGGNHGPDGR